jgi:hypothetical protein
MPNDPEPERPLPRVAVHVDLPLRQPDLQEIKAEAGSGLILARMAFKVLMRQQEVAVADNEAG